MVKLIHKLLYIFIPLILLIIPFLIYGNNFLVGGDDTRLYYIYPLEFIKNYAINIASDNTLAGAMTGYASVAYYIPFFTVINFMRLIPLINTQMLMYGFNLFFGFIAFYKLLGLYIEQKNEAEKYISILGSLFYIFSTYIVKTHYLHQMIAMYLVSILPVCLYLFILSVRKNRIGFLVLSVFIFSIFSTTLNTIPWWGGFVITSLPLLVYEFLNNKKSFINKSLIGLFLFILLNLYWIFHYVYPLINKQSDYFVSQNYSSQEFINDNIRVVTGVSKLISPINIILNKMEYNLSDIKITPLDFIPLIIILIGIALSLKENKKMKLIFNLILVGYLFSWFFFSPNLGEWGPRIFIYLSKHIPFFTMFRNMQDKFSISLAMYLSLLITLSVVFIERRLNKYLKLSLFILVFYFLFVLIPQYFITSEETKISYSIFNGKFNNDFVELADYLKSSDDYSKILWLPLNSPTYLNISGLRKNEFYSGLSPIEVLTGKTDYTGRFSFIVGNDFFLGEDVFKMLKDGNYIGFGNLLKKLNISYIVYSNEIVPERFKNFLYGGEDLPVLRMQESQALKDGILGEHIRDFGNTYKLYKINNKYESYKIYLENNDDVIPINYQKINSEEYILDGDSLMNNNGKIVFSELNSGYWVLKNGERILNKSVSDKYTNVWDINNYKLTKNELLLKFIPKKYNLFIYTISLLTASTLVIYLIWNFSFYKK